MRESIECQIKANITVKNQSNYFERPERGRSILAWLLMGSRARISGKPNQGACDGVPGSARRFVPLMSFTKIPIRAVSYALSAALPSNAPIERQRNVRILQIIRGIGAKRIKAMFARLGLSQSTESRQNGMSLNLRSRVGIAQSVQRLWSKAASFCSWIITTSAAPIPRKHAASAFVDYFAIGAIRTSSRFMTQYGLRLLLPTWSATK
jgi:hypothetical protein